MREVCFGARVLFTVFAAAVVASPIIGCHSDAGQPLSDAQKQGADRLATIAKASGGDWEKVSQADRDYLIKNVANGDEHTAKMLIAPPPGGGGKPSGAGPSMGGPPGGRPGPPPGAPAGAAAGQ